MGRKIALSGFEKGNIFAFKNPRLPEKIIAKKLKRSPGVIVNLKEYKGTKKSPGHPSKPSKRVKKTIIKRLGNKKINLGLLAKNPIIAVLKIFCQESAALSH